MAGQDQGDRREFQELGFAEQARSITATVNDLQAAIEYHVEHSPRRSETIEECLVLIERLEERLRNARDQRTSPSDSGREPPGAEGMPRLRVGSPRLAEPERAADFAMDVAEES